MDTPTTEEIIERVKDIADTLTDDRKLSRNQKEDLLGTLEATYDVFSSYARYAPPSGNSIGRRIKNMILKFHYRLTYATLAETLERQKRFNQAVKELLS